MFPYTFIHNHAYLWYSSEEFIEYRRYLSWPFQYSFAQPSTSCISDIACKLGSMAKNENPMKNWLIIQLMKLLRVMLHKSVCSSNSPSIHLFFCPMECPSVHLSVRLSVCPSVCPSHTQIHGKLQQAPMLDCHALSRRICFHRCNNNNNNNHTNNSNNNNNNKKDDDEDETLNFLLRYSRTDGFRTLQTVSKLQTG